MGACFVTTSRLVLQDNKFSNIWDHFTFVKNVGEGMGGPVVAAWRKNKDSDRPYALKKLSKNISYNRRLFEMEVSILRELDHPNIIKLVDCFEDAQYFFVATDLCDGRDLAARVCEFPYFTEQMAARLIRRMLEIVQYCHTKGVIHRDLKPANFVFSTKSDNSASHLADEMKLIDFGTAAFVQDHKKYRSKVGTVFYQAPELSAKTALSGFELKKADVWAVGVMAGLLIMGRPPVLGNDVDEIRTNAQRFGPDFSDCSISEDARDFIELVLDPDPLRRPSPAECLAHQWVAGDLAAAPQFPIALDVLDKLRVFAARCFAERTEQKIRKAALIGRRYSNREIHLLRTFSSNDVLRKKYSSRRLVVDDGNGGRPPGPPEASVSGSKRRKGAGGGDGPGTAGGKGGRRRSAEALNIPKISEESSPNSNAFRPDALSPRVVSAYNPSPCVLTQANLNLVAARRTATAPCRSPSLSAAHGARAGSPSLSVPSTRGGSLSWQAPPMPSDVASYLSDLDTERVVSEQLVASERFDLATIVRDIRGDAVMKVSDLASALDSLALSKRASSIDRQIIVSTPSRRISAPSPPHSLTPLSLAPLSLAGRPLSPRRSMSAPLSPRPDQVHSPRPVDGPELNSPDDDRPMRSESFSFGADVLLQTLSS
eukprot:591620_1